MPHLHVSLKHTLIATLLGSLLLQGCAPVVVGAAATGGSVAVDRRTAGTYIDDQTIELKAEKMIDSALGQKIHANVVSYNLHVLITGEAIDQASKDKAESIVKGIANVKGITNELMIGDKSDLASRSQDAFITSKVKANLINDANISANNIKVFTERSIVYLMGLVSKKEAALAVEIARSTTDVEKIVKVFEYTD